MSKLLTALVTPFLQNQSVDFESLDQLIEDQIKQGTDGIILLGTTAEAELLHAKERASVLTYVLKNYSHRIRLIAGCGKSSTEQTLEQIKSYQALGITEVMVVTPMYVKPTQEGVLAHYQRINELGVGFIIYHHPFRTGCHVNHQTLESILNLSNCIGLKDASGSCEVLSKLSHKSKIFSGDDSLILPHLSLGAGGIISVISNIIPADVKQVLHLFNSSPHEARLQFYKYQKLLEAIFEIPNPIGIKTALFHLGKIQNQFRLPYTQASDASSQNILMKLQELVPNVIDSSPISSSV